MRIVFMGTPEFALPSFLMLLEEGYEVIAVVTQPDKPKGRGNKLAPPPIKEVAIEKGIKVLQPAKVKNNPEFLKELQDLAPDLLVTAAYGKILPQSVLDVPKLGCMNVHGSLLPQYRGAAPIQWSIINGDKITGITTMYTDIGMDTGDMLLKEEFTIPENMTAGELNDKLAIVGARVLKETLKLLDEGKLTRIPQPNDSATYVTMLTKETGLIDWSKSATEIHNLVRGTNPWPGAFTFYKGERMRIWQTSCVDIESKDNAGVIQGSSSKGLLVNVGDGQILIELIQFDGGKKMKVEDYLRGHELEKGVKLDK